jgi:hypothetical protein
MPARFSPFVTILTLLAMLAHAVADTATLASVRYTPSGTGHELLSVGFDATEVGDRSIAVDLYLFERRYVAIYTEGKRTPEGNREIVFTKELSGTTDTSGTSAALPGLGRIKIVEGTKNRKPRVDLVIDTKLATAPVGTVVHLQWIYASWAPKSVTQH